LERALANWKGTDAALCFSSGYVAALGTIPALVTKNDVVLLDKLCHASLIYAARLSGANLRIFPRNNLRKLESHLEWSRREHSGKRVLIVTESVFSMDGDRAPLRELVQLKKEFDAMLMLDEAHAVPASNRRGCPRCSEFSFVFRRRKTKASPLGENRIDAGASYGVGRWKFGVVRWTFRRWQ
jgi:7-keto-8-aminopelargonate synthetase-like enzyme